MDITFQLTLSNKKWDVLSRNDFTTFELYIISYYGSVIYQIAISNNLLSRAYKVFFRSDVILGRWNIIELVLKEFSFQIGFHNMNYKDFIFPTFFSRLFIYEKCVPIWKQRSTCLLKVKRTTKFRRIIVNDIRVWNLTSKTDLESHE